MATKSMDELNGLVSKFQELDKAKAAIAAFDFKVPARVVIGGSSNLAAMHNLYEVADNDVNLGEVATALLWHNHYTVEEQGNSLIVTSDELKDRFEIEFQSDDNILIYRHEPGTQTNLRTGEVSFVGYHRLKEGHSPMEEMLSSLSYSHKEHIKMMEDVEKQIKSGVPETEIANWKRNAKPIDVSDCVDRYTLFLAMRFTRIFIKTPFANNDNITRIQERIQDKARKNLWRKSGFNWSDFPKIVKSEEKGA